MQHTFLPSRAAGIVIHDDKLLVMYRKRNQNVYYTFPGGTVESNESPEQATIREIFEETSINVKITNLVYQLDVITKSKTKEEYFYICQYISGVPELQPDSIESARLNYNDFYQPMWLSLKQLEQTILYPLEIRDQLINDLKNGFSEKIIHFSLQRSAIRQA